MCTLYKKTRSDLLFLILLKLNCRTNENQRQNESHREKKPLWALDKCCHSKYSEWKERIFDCTVL